MLQHLNIYCEWVSCCCAWMAYSKNKSRVVFLFGVFLLLNFLLEIGSCYLEKYRQSQVIMNINILIPVLFYAYIFRLFMAKRKTQRVILTLSFLYWIYWMIAVATYGRLNFFDAPLMLVSCIVQQLFCCFYFHYYLSNDTSQRLAFYDNAFLISVGVFIFNVVVTACVASAKISYYSKFSLFGLPIYVTIPKIMCVVLYTPISIALLKWEKKY